MGKIKIIKNGPFLVSGSIPLQEMIIEHIDGKNVYKLGRKFDVPENYALCRCGDSLNKPFCDGKHVDVNFQGKSVASKQLFEEQAITYEGNNLILKDQENLCAFARFCHAHGKDIWTLTENTSSEEDEKLAIQMAEECPAGRLVMYDKSGKAFEPEFEESIIILQDPERECSGPLWIRGWIEIEDEDQNILEKRNRITLCRCGKSSNKPFCDASHIDLFKDNYYDEN